MLTTKKHVIQRKQNNLRLYALWFGKCFPFDGGSIFKGKRTTGENAMTGQGKVG